MEAFAGSYKLDFVFVGVGGAGLAKVFRTFEPDIDLSVRRVDDRANRQTAYVVRYPDRHFAFPFDEATAAEHLRLDAETPLLSEHGSLLFAAGDANRNFVNETGIADGHSKRLADR